MPPRAELDPLAVDQDQAAVAGQGAVRDDEVEGVGLAAAGLAAEQHVAFGEVDVDLVAVLVDAQVHRVEHGQREHRHGDGDGGHGWWPPFGCQAGMQAPDGSGPAVPAW